MNARTMKIWHYYMTVLISLVWLVESCSKSSTTNNTTGGGSISFSCTGISPKFGADVMPIFNTVCSINSNCHGSGSTNSGGPFTNYALINAKTSNIRSAVLAGVMPQSGTISQAQINNLICWIDSGAPNN